MDLARCAVAEFIGVALFQFFGGLPGAGATGNGLALIVLIYMTASVSGGHLNPAVSAALAVTKQITPKKMGLYMFCQFLGGICGASIDYTINATNNQKIFGAACTSESYAALNIPSGSTIPGCTSCTLTRLSSAGTDALNAGQAFGVEFLATFLLVFTVFACAVDPRGAAGNAAPWAIGASLWAAASGIGGLTGGALNPARTLSPALVFSCWNIYDMQTGSSQSSYWYMYVIAQLIAGCAAGLIYQYAFLNRPDDGQPGPASVFKFVARDGMAVTKELKNAASTEPTPAPAAPKVKGPITPRGGRPTTPKGKVRVAEMMI